MHKIRLLRTNKLTFIKRVAESPLIDGTIWQDEYDRKYNFTWNLFANLKDLPINFELKNVEHCDVLGYYEVTDEELALLLLQFG